MRRIESCIVASFAIFTVSMSSLSYFLCFSFSSQSSNFLLSTGPPFLVVGFAEEDEVDEDDEVGEGVGQVRLREKLENSCSCILVLVGVVVLVQKVGCASGDDAGDAEVVAPCVAVLHAESASSCSMHAVGVDSSRR